MTGEVEGWFGSGWQGGGQAPSARGDRGNGRLVRLGMTGEVQGWFGSGLPGGGKRPGSGWVGGARGGVGMADERGVAVPTAIRGENGSNRVGRVGGVRPDVVVSGGAEASVRRAHLLVIGGGCRDAALA